MPAPIAEDDAESAAEGVPAVAAEVAESSDDVPVLVPESDEPEEVDSFADTHVPLVVPDSADANSPEAPALEAEAEESGDIELTELDTDETLEDKLVVSEWPDPAESGG